MVINTRQLPSNSKATQLAPRKDAAAVITSGADVHCTAIKDYALLLHRKTKDNALVFGRPLLSIRSLLPDSLFVD